MKKNGFTLIELIATILILGVIAMIIVPITNNILIKSKEKLYNEQIDRIEKLAKEYAIENNEILLNEGGKIYIGDLINKGYLERKDIINPITNENMTGCVIVSYANEKYKYKYSESCIEEQ